MVKALVLLSGGLDSRLALKIMQEQLGKKNVKSIYFDLPFGSGCCSQSCSFNFTQMHDSKLIIVDCTKGKLFKKYLKIVRGPKFGYGRALNPCVDCHLFMLKLAKDYADKKNIDLIVTGEVVGERPKSQYKKALLLLEKESKLKGRLLRPLSAKLLPLTNAEKKGLIKREKLFDIHGRRRERQIALAKKYKISYPSPAGGCLLCEGKYCEKLKKILDKKDLNYNDVKLLRIGRHFEASQIILGKDDKENKLLEKEKGIKIIPEQPGPTALVKNKKDVDKAKKLIKKYSKHKIKEFKNV